MSTTMGGVILVMSFTIISLACIITERVSNEILYKKSKVITRNFDGRYEPVTVEYLRQMALYITILGRIDVATDTSDISTNTIYKKSVQYDICIGTAGIMLEFDSRYTRLINMVYSKWGGVYEDKVDTIVAINSKIVDGQEFFEALDLMANRISLALDN